MYGEHECTVCLQPMGQHEMRCEYGEVYGPERHNSNLGWPFHNHFPPLCCPGCGCGSFEESHPQIGAVLAAERGDDCPYCYDPLADSGTLLWHIPTASTYHALCLFRSNAQGLTHA